MPIKNTLAGIIQDTRQLLSFHQALEIDAYPLTEELSKLLKKSVPKAKAKRTRMKRPPSPLPQNDQQRHPTADTPSSPASPPETLTDIRRQLGDCTRCTLHKNRSSILFGAGPTDAKLMIIGEWPNKEDDQTGEMFSGPDGEMLGKMLNYVLKTDREDVYIASIIKCLAGETNPSTEQINTCLPFLLAQIRTIHPRVIWTMGPAAAQTLLQTNKPLIRLRGRFHNFKGIPLMPTFHPAYLAKNPEMKKAVFQDLKMIEEKLAG